jgi:hypothetical protein
MDANDDCQFEDLTFEGCALCRRAFGDGPKVHCPDCDVTLHTECWSYEQTCPVFGCGNAVRVAIVPPQIRTSGLRIWGRRWFPFWMLWAGLAGFAMYTLAILHVVWKAIPNPP